MTETLKPAMTVAELIARLAAFPPDMPVFFRDLEGYDADYWPVRVASAREVDIRHGHAFTWANLLEPESPAPVTVVALT